MLHIIFSNNQQLIITNVDNTKKLAPILPNRNKNYTNSIKVKTSNKDDVDFVITDELRMVACKSIDPTVFEVSSVTGPIILLKILKPSLCPICHPKRKNQNPHEKENAFLYISSSNGNVYFYCWRQKDFEKNFQSEGISRRIVNNIGKLVMSKRDSLISKDLASKYLTKKPVSISGMALANKTH